MILILFLIAAIIFTFLYQGLAVRKSYYTFKAACELREVHYAAIIDLSDQCLNEAHGENTVRLKSIIRLTHLMSTNFAAIDGFNFSSFKLLISILIMGSKNIATITVEETESERQKVYISGIFKALNTALRALPASTIRLVLELLKIIAIFAMHVGREKIKGYINQLEKFLIARSNITHNMCSY